jgi:tRNA-2-methylthio-N6-dimethylallyladenosine synthase
MSQLVKLSGRRPAPQADPVPPPQAEAAAGETLAGQTARRVYVETYGCQLNVADSETMLGVLRGAGYAPTDDPRAADLILLNTCAVRERAEERVFARAGVLGALKRERPQLKLGITGCMAEHLKETIQQRAPHVDLVVGPDGYRRLPQHLGDLDRGARRLRDTELDRHETYEGLDPRRDDDGGVVGRVTIQRGCDKFCTFCVVPYTRGRERGTPPREVLRQVRTLAAAGYREVQLLGQTVNSYRYGGAGEKAGEKAGDVAGEGGGDVVGFAELLRAVAAVPGIARVRFMSPYPLDFSPEVIAAIAETPNVAKHVHLPLQSGADSVLERMRRGYDYAQFKALVGDLRRAVPDIAISTDFLVGFCDETEAEFAALLAAAAELRFDGAFIFAYSERSGTLAARKMPDTVPEAVKQRRLAEVNLLQRRITAEKNAELVGRRLPVLVENRSRRSADEWFGRTESMRSVILPAGPGVQPGSLLDVVIESASVATLVGRVVAPS